MITAYFDNLDICFHNLLNVMQKKYICRKYHYIYINWKCSREGGSFFIKREKKKSVPKTKYVLYV